MALEAQHSYLQLQNLLAAIGNTQSARQQLSIANAQADPQLCGKDNLAEIQVIQAKHAGLKLKQQLLPMVQQRLSTRATRQPQLADL